MAGEERAKIHRGLKGVYFDRSPVCFIDGRAGELRYRGYSIHDLAEHSTFEETCYLLLYGELPSGASLRHFRKTELKARHAADAVVTTSSAICVTRIRWTCCAPRYRRSPPSIPTTPTIPRGHAAQGHPADVAGADDRRRARAAPERAEPVAPDPQLGHAANFLCMLKGKRADRPCGAADGHGHDPACRARLERIRVHRARGRRHRGQPARRDDRGDRRAVGPGARRRGGERDAHGAGDRRRRRTRPTT